MSIQDYKATAVYLHCLNDMDPNLKPARIAVLADAATNGVVSMCQGPMNGGYDIKFPNDDRCMSIELKIFRTLCEANEVSIDAIYWAIN